jgi:hypothetical protein
MLVEVFERCNGVVFYAAGLLTRNAAVAMPIPRAIVEAMSSEDKKEYGWKVDESSRPFLPIVNPTVREDELECRALVLKSRMPREQKFAVTPL